MEVKGGNKLAKVLAEIGKDSSGLLKLGFLGDKTYPDGTSVASVAFWNEFGHAGPFPAPPRPFFRNMISEKSGEWPGRLSKALKYYDYDGEKALSAMGSIMKDELIESIYTLTDPPLSKTTLMLRSIYGNNPHEIRARDVLAAQELVAEGYGGASGTQAKPLVWTGVMAQSIDYVVEGLSS